jgi:hypothetical protein
MLPANSTNIFITSTHSRSYIDDSDTIASKIVAALPDKCTRTIVAALGYAWGNASSVHLKQFEETFEELKLAHLNAFSDKTDRINANIEFNNAIREKLADLLPDNVLTTYLDHAHLDVDYDKKKARMQKWADKHAVTDVASVASKVISTLPDTHEVTIVDALRYSWGGTCENNLKLFAKNFEVLKKEFLNAFSDKAEKFNALVSFNSEIREQLASFLSDKSMKQYSDLASSDINYEQKKNAIREWTGSFIAFATRMGYYG